MGRKRLIPEKIGIKLREAEVPKSHRALQEIPLTLDRRRSRPPEVDDAEKRLAGFSRE